MTAYIIRRLLLVIPTLIGIMTVNFIIIQIAPGGPVEQMIAQIQGEAEGAFIKTAAAVRGVREGAQKLSRAARMKTQRTESSDQEADTKDSDSESLQ